MASFWRVVRRSSGTGLFQAIDNGGGITPHHRIIGGSFLVTEAVGVEGASDPGAGFTGDLLHGTGVFNAFKEDRLDSLIPDDADDFLYML